VLLGMMLFLIWIWPAGEERLLQENATFRSRRGTLEINVVEGGNIQALESQEIKCEVRVGYQGTKILKIVEEGYQVTAEDVQNGKVLVELDSSELDKLLAQQEIQFQSALAALADAEQAYDIQLNQNISDIKAAEQKARFAFMDFEKFLGNPLAQTIVTELGVGKLPVIDLVSMVPNLGDFKKPDSPLETIPPSPSPELKMETPDVPKLVELKTGTLSGLLPEATGDGSAEPSVSEMFNQAMRKSWNAYTNALAKSVLIEFTQYADADLLGDGEAKQKLRKFEDDLLVARKELGQAEITLEGTKRLYEKNFVTRTDLQRDEIAYENNRLKVKTAETAQDLFLKYDFAKTAEETLSKYTEAVRELDRATKGAVARLAQAEAKLKSAQAQYAVQLRQLNDLEQQIAKCIIRAEKTGLVVYGGARDNMIYYGGQEQIREGATVRERQAIITIPDMTQMGVQVKIHESYIKKVTKGQKTRITVDAYADNVLEGEVTKVGVLPDSQNRWMNPDLKVYLTTIKINDVHSWLKPGMSAKAEIFVNMLKDVVHIPLQAVVTEHGKRYCYVMEHAQPMAREIETGQFTDEFIEIVSGLDEGELVLLHPPINPDSQEAFEPEKGPESPATKESHIQNAKTQTSGKADI